MTAAGSTVADDGAVRYSFGGYVLDTARRELWCDQAQVHVEPQVFDVLAHLVARRGRVVPKEELLDEIWGSRFVSESTLTSRVKAARRAVGDHGTVQATIRTIRGRGFRFVAPVAELRDDAPPPDRPPPPVVDAGQGGPRPLPRPATRVVGRAAELAAAREALRRSRLVTILGPGGVGKTTLAMQVAAAEQDRFTHGAYWCDWASVTDGAAATDALADALDVHRQSSLTAEASIAAAIGERHLLVVTDNCEHIVGHAAELLSSLVTTCPKLSVLTTSRSPLAVPAEALCPLTPLPCSRVPPDPTGPPAGGVDGEGTDGRGWSLAASLFVERARAADPRSPLDERRDAIERLCRRVDGLPLAIELAAARLRTSTLDEVAAHLTDALDVAATPRRGRIPRHETLRNTIDWSYQLLDPPARRVFEHLSVFSASFSAGDAVDLAHRLGAQRSGVVAALDELVDQSLVAADRTGRATRYRVLETLRAFGRRHLGEDESRQLSDAHAAWALRTAERSDRDVRGSAEAAAVQRFAELFANVRTAHRHAVATGDVDTALRLTAACHDYATFRLRDEAVSWADAACAMPHAMDHALAPVVLGCLAQGLANRGELRRARLLATEAVRRGGSTDGRAYWALRTLGEVAVYEGRLDDAVDTARLAVEVADRAGDDTHASYALVTHVLARAYSGRVGEALEWVRDHYARAERSGNPTQIAWSRYARGEVLAVTDPRAALPVLEEALVIGSSTESNYVVGVALVTIASVSARLGRHDQAFGTFARTIDLWHRRGDWTHQWTTLRNLVGLLQSVGRPRDAAWLLGATTAPGRGTPIFGETAPMLDTVSTRLTAALGATDAGRLVADGRRASPDEAVERARAAIAAATPTSRHAATSRHRPG